MARNNAPKIELTAYDDLFQTDESRAEAKLSKIRDIPLSQIDEFPDHPFKVLMDEDMQQLVESIKRNGIMTPATVRLKEDGRYELVSGHRRKKACELAGLETLKCEVKELTRDEAIIVMVESNLQRSTILPSEKAFADLNRNLGIPQSKALSNPLPDIIIVTLKPEASSEEAAAAAQKIEAIKGVDLVPYEASWHEKMLAVSRAAYVGLICLGGAAALLVALVLAAAIRMSTTSAASQMRVLKTFGASPVFAVRPYAWRGALLLGVASSAALVIARTELLVFSRYVNEAAKLYESSIELQLPALSLQAAFILAAAFLGSLTAAAAAADAWRRLRN